MPGQHLYLNAKGIKDSNTKWDNFISISKTAQSTLLNKDKKWKLIDKIPLNEKSLDNKL